MTCGVEHDAYPVAISIRRLPRRLRAAKLDGASHRGLEVDEAISRGLISQNVRQACLDIASELDARMRVHDPVFDDVAWARLEAAIALELQPITDIV